MNKKNLYNNIQKINNEISKHSPAILTGLAVTGFVTTVVMACKSTPKAIEVLDDFHKKQEELKEKPSKQLQAFKEVCVVAPVYLPSAIIGILSIGCVIGSYSINTRRTAALATAYSISERTLHEYQNKVIDTIGEKKEEKIRDEIAKDRVKENPPSDNNIIVTNNGEMLCFDSSFGRYFMSSIEKIRKAETVLNRRLINEMYVSLNEFYDEIDISHVGAGDDLGWNVDEMIELNLHSILLDDDRTCLVVDHGIAPRYDYRNIM